MIPAWFGVALHIHGIALGAWCCWWLMRKPFPWEARR